MDDRLRRLERAASAGDPEARALLAANRHRAGERSLVRCQGWKRHIPDDHCETCAGTGLMGLDVSSVYGAMLRDRACEITAGWVSRRHRNDVRSVGARILEAGSVEILIRYMVAVSGVILRRGKPKRHTRARERVLAEIKASVARGHPRIPPSREKLRHCEWIPRSLQTLPPYGVDYTMLAQERILRGDENVDMFSHSYPEPLRVGRTLRAAKTDETWLQEVADELVPWLLGEGDPWLALPQPNNFVEVFAEIEIQEPPSGGILDDAEAMIDDLTVHGSEALYAWSNGEDDGLMHAVPHTPDQPGNSSSGEEGSGDVSGGEPDPPEVP